MASIFYSVIREDCQEISSSVKENGLLEFVIPKECSNKEFSDYFRGLDTVTIADKQAKAKEKFRKNIMKMIEKYEEEFKLPLLVKLRLATKTKKLNECNVEIAGLDFITNVSIMAILQYVSIELVETVVRYTVYALACQYEQLCYEHPTRGFNVIDGKTGEDKQIGVMEGPKYEIPIKYDEVKKIQQEYESAFKKIIDELDKQKIMNT